MAKTFEEWLEIINEEVNFFVQSFNTEYSADMGADFCCFPMFGEIEWSLLVVDKGAFEFYENFCSRYQEAEDFGIFTLSLLHEIGHLETVKEMDFGSTGRQTVGMTNKEYFKLHDEMIATDWAGKWIRENLGYAQIIDKHFSNLLSQMWAEVITE